jgi:uncharacterized OB-fold protein
MRIAHWREGHPRYQMTGGRCRTCCQPVFPPRPFCPLCSMGSLVQGMRWEALALGMRSESTAMEAGTKAT